MRVVNMLKYRDYGTDKDVRLYSLLALRSTRTIAERERLDRTIATMQAMIDTPPRLFESWMEPLYASINTDDDSTTEFEMRDL